MTIALDYDNTYTRDPDSWDEFIRLFHTRGHLIICVTQRGEDNRPGRNGDRVPCDINRDVEGTLTMEPIPVICAGLVSKMDAAKAAGYAVAVWIDDDPVNVGYGQYQVRNEVV